MKHFVALSALVLILSSGSLSQAPPASIPSSSAVDARQLLRDIEILSSDDMEGRKAGTRGNAKARDYVVQRFKASGIAPIDQSYLYPFSGGVNIAGYIRGESRPERYIVISAHYDHVGIQNGRIYNGADDNASGVSALFALASYFSKHRPKNSILFVSFDAEEGGLRGSRAFLRAPAVSKDAMIININLDMIGRDKNRTLYVIGTFLQPFLKPYVDRLMDRSKVKLLAGHDMPSLGDDDDWTDDSDHYSFHREGIPFLFFSVEDYDHYHKPDDDYESIMPDFYVGSVETILDLILAVDQSFVGR
jgi:hypothetical protein